MAFDEGLGRGMPRVKPIGTGDDEYSVLAPGVLSPNQPPPYNPANDKQTLFNTGQAGGSAYSGYNSPRYGFGQMGGGGGFASIMSSLMGKTYPSGPAMPEGTTTDDGTSAPSTPVRLANSDDSSALSPALTGIMRDSSQTGGSNIQAIMSDLLKRKRRPAMPLSY